MSNQNNKEENRNLPDKKKPTVAERFVGKVSREFEGAVGQDVDFTEEQKQLASNLFVKIDQALKDHESDRLSKNNSNKITPYTWENINMQKLATDAVHRVRLGLDALIKNHIHVVPYFNGKKKKYDLNLQVGYRGKDYYRRKMAVEKVNDIRYELVHENDHFKVIKKSTNQQKDEYEFEIKDPWNRGEIVGGFGYIEYEDESKNRVVLVPEEEFQKVKGTAQTNKIWNQWPEKMRLKTLVHRVTDELTMDPKKINPSYSYVEEQESPFSDPSKEIPQQPEASEREDLDFGDEGDGQPDDAEDVDFEEEPEVDQQTDSTNGTSQEESSTAGNGVAKDKEREELKAEVNKLGKQVFGSISKWVTESKAMVANYDENASDLTDIGIDGLKHIKKQLEHKAKSEA